MSKILCEGPFIRWKPRPPAKESFIATAQKLKEFLHALWEKHGLIPH